MLASLGLHVDPVSTQIVQRDRHAAFLTAIAIVGGSLERFATEVRNLQHTEIGELQEPFKAGQKGSSRDAAQAEPDPLRADRGSGAAAARLRPYSARGPAALARAGHQPFECRARHPARRDDPAGLHARPVDRRWSMGCSCVRSGCARTSNVGSGSMRRRASWSPSSTTAGCRARTPTPSSSELPSVPPTSGPRCATCWRSIRRSPSGSRLSQLDAASTTPRSCATCPR